VSDQPTGPDHLRWADSTGAYVLDALPEEEARGFEAHLVQCPACRQEIDSLIPAAELLPMSVVYNPAPPALKGRLMAEVNREAALLAAAGAEADRPQPVAPAPVARRRGRLAGLLSPWSGGLAVAAVLLGLVAGKLIWDAGEPAAPTRPATPRTQVFAATVDQKLAPNVSGRLEVRGGEATLVLTGLQAPPRGRTYQVWVLRPGGAPIPTDALFTPSRSGSATAPVTPTLGRGVQVLVSVEPIGGSRAPTTTPFLSARAS
jgi:anti-sigma-K factor RskA